MSEPYTIDAVIHELPEGAHMEEVHPKDKPFFYLLVEAPKNMVWKATGQNVIREMVWSNNIEDGVEYLLEDISLGIE